MFRFALFFILWGSQPVSSVDNNIVSTYKYEANRLIFLVPKSDHTMDFNNLPRRYRGYIFSEAEIRRPEPITVNNIMDALDDMDGVGWRYCGGYFIITTTEHIHNFLDHH